MLDNGNPPDNWDSLLLAAKKEEERLSLIVRTQKSYSDND
jgi:hypothetical protein